MSSPKPVFITDACIGGLSAVKSMWGYGHAANALFMADYDVNPLGVKDESAIAEMVSKWFSMAAEHADTVVIPLIVMFFSPASPGCQPAQPGFDS